MNNRRELSEIYNRLTIQQKKQFENNLAKLQAFNRLSEKQKENAVRKLFEILKTKVAPVVLSALMLASPMVLTGCDENSSILGSNTNQSAITDINGNIIEEPTGEVTTTENSVIYEPIEEKYAQRLQGAFKSWNINGVVDQKYSSIVLDAIRRIEKGERLQFLSGINTKVEPTIDTVYLSLKKLLDDNAEYAIKVSLKKENQGADIKFYRKGTDTATFIITKNGKTYYNGIINNEVYAEGAEFLPSNFPVLFNEETAAIFNQLNKKDLGKLYGNELISFMFLGGLPTQEKNAYLRRFLSERYEKHEFVSRTSVAEFSMFSYIDHQEAVLNSDGEVITPAKDVGILSDVSLIVNSVYDIKKKEDEQIPTITSFYVEAGDLQQYKKDYILVVEENGTFKRYPLLVRDGYRVAEMSVNYTPENIILPTTEAELSK